MLDRPDLCGGMHQALDCYERHAEKWLTEIARTIDDIDSPIIKVRAGYILEEMLALEHTSFSQWVRCAQRGGSRKLDPHSPYGNRFSERWMLAPWAGIAADMGKVKLS